MSTNLVFMINLILSIACIATVIGPECSIDAWIF